MTELANEFTVAHLHFPANGNGRRPPFDFPVFERTIVDIHQLGLVRNLPAVVGIVHYQVGVASQRDSAFARKQPEKLRGLVLHASTNVLRSMRPRFTPYV